MKLNDAFPSNYLKSEDFTEGEEKDVVIAKVILEKMTNRDSKEENKPVLHFSNTDKQMVVNATNWKRIAQITGEEDSDNWAGKKITLYTEIVDAFGEMKPAIRVKLVSAKQALIDAYWIKVREMNMSTDEGRAHLKEHGGDFVKATAALEF